MTRTPRSRARRSRGGGSARLSSGAPPVMSSVEMRRRSRKASTRSATSRRHLLGAVRAGIDVAMHAGLVAAIADIDLQRVERPAPERRKRDLLEQRPSVAHQRASRTRRFVRAASLPQRRRPRHADERTATDNLRVRGGDAIVMPRSYLAAGAATAVPSSMPMRPKPGSFTAGWRRSRPATSPSKLSSMPSTQPSLDAEQAAQR